jgi:hypothetical protein
MSKNSSSSPTVSRGAAKHGVCVVDRREVADALVLGDPDHEPVQPEPRRPASGPGLAALQRRVKLHRGPLDQLVDLAAVDPLGEGLQHGLGRPACAVAIDAGVRGDEPEEPLCGAPTALRSAGGPVT